MMTCLLYQQNWEDIGDNHKVGVVLLKLKITFLGLFLAIKSFQYTANLCSNGIYFSVV